MNKTNDSRALSVPSGSASAYYLLGMGNRATGLRMDAENVRRLILKREPQAALDQLKNMEREAKALRMELAKWNEHLSSPNNTGEP